MANSHIKYLIKLAQDESLIDLLGWNTFFNPHDTEEFIEAISSYAFPILAKVGLYHLEFA